MSNKFYKCLTTLSLSAMLFGTAIPATTNVFASSNSDTQTTESKNDNGWKNHNSKDFISARGYGIFKDNWKRIGSTNNRFHEPVTINSSKKFKNKGTYYKILNGDKYLGFVNSKALTKDNQNIYLNKVPYVSQYKPIFAPWGCAEASLSMLIRSTGKKVNMNYIFAHTPMLPTKGGQKGNVYTGKGFGHVITANALAKYGHRWTNKIRNISGSTIEQLKQYVQSGHPVLFYGYSSYQRPADHNRNHCKVITAYKNGMFRVYDPLYYSKAQGAGTGGRNMLFDRGAVSWYSMKRLNYEYAHVTGNNRKSALTVY